jgi:hypothetical protein
MYSQIAKRVDNEIMNFTHIGNIKNGVELPQDETTESWSGCTENYMLVDASGGTLLTVEMDMTEDFINYFNEKFPLALNIVKELAEA